MWDVPFSPIPVGTTATIRVWNLPAPASCTMVAKFSDGTSANLGTKIAVYIGPSPGSTAAYAAIWHWAVPATAALGEGKLYSACTYLGVKRTDSWFGFRLVAS